MTTTRSTLSPEKAETLLKILQASFEKNRQRHRDIEWEDVLVRLAADAGKLRSLGEMERTGGEPDVIGREVD